MAVQSESDGTSVQGHLIRMRCTRTVGVRALRDDTGINSQHHIEYSPVALGVVAQPLWHRQHPLAQRQPVKDVMGKVLGRLNHARCVARGGGRRPDPCRNRPQSSRAGHQHYQSPGKVRGEYAAFEVFAKGLAQIAFWLADAFIAQVAANTEANYTLSKIKAMPCPTPMHIVHKA